jgi:hypothetical protein
MNKSRLLGAMCACVVTFICNQSNAAVVFSQPPLDGGVSYAAVSNFQTSDDFVLSSDASITNIRWWGGEGTGSGVADTFSIRFFSDTGTSSPQATPFLTMTVANPVRSATGLNAFPGQPIFEYAASLPQVVPLLGSESYYISIITQQPINWGWAASTSNTEDHWSRRFDGESWTLNLADMAFELSEVPVPAAVWLFGSGLLGLMGISRRRKA